MCVLNNFTFVPNGHNGITETQDGSIYRFLKEKGIGNYEGERRGPWREVFYVK